MALPLYLAMTAAEFSSIASSVANCAWMACHYSCYGTGLSNCPETLPEGAMLIVNDRTPPCGHDPAYIARQLQALVQELPVSCVLLDLQRHEFSENAQIAEAVVQTLPCPVAVPAHYAAALSCSVLLSPPPLHKPLKDYLAPWHGRDIWMEAALDCEQITVTAEGSRYSGLSEPPVATGFDDTHLHCRYQLTVTDEQAQFALWRTPEHLSCLLQEAQELGVTKAVALYQELGMHFSPRE